MPRPPMDFRIPTPFLLRLFLCAAAAAAACAPAEARLFDTRERLSARFGEPIEERPPPHGLGLDGVLVFEKEGVTITVDMLRGQAVRIRYAKLKFFTDAEVATLLMANSEDNDISDWLGGKKVVNSVGDSIYVRADRKADARLHWNELVVTSNIYYDLVRAAAQRRSDGIADKLKDF